MLYDLYLISTDTHSPLLVSLNPTLNNSITLCAYVVNKNRIPKRDHPVTHTHPTHANVGQCLRDPVPEHPRLTNPIAAIGTNFYPAAQTPIAPSIRPNPPPPLPFTLGAIRESLCAIRANPCKSPLCASASSVVN